jgi:hypothetical protein
VYVANRLVLPELDVELLPKFKSAEINLDLLTKAYIHSRLEYQFLCVSSSSEAFVMEERCRRGEVFGTKPYLNPKGT